MSKRISIPSLCPAPGRQRLRRAPGPHPQRKPLWVRTFRTVEELRQALLEFRRRRHENLIIQRHGQKTAVQVRREQLHAWPLAA